jgi:hypothetical protein
MLQEGGLAEALPNGFWIGQEDVAGLDDEQADILQLPPRYPFSFGSRISGRSGHSSFSVDLFAETSDGSAPFERKGPFLQLGSSESYRLTPAELMGLLAWERHRSLSPEERGETANLRLMAELQTAARSGMRVDLGHFERFDLVVPEGIGVTGTRMPDGSLLLSPSLGDGSTPDELQKRWSQLDLDDDGGVLRIGHRIVLLDEQKMNAIREVFANQSIPAERVREFLDTPSAFLDAALVDLDIGFSVRVAGVGQLRHLNFEELDSTGEDWFGVSEIPATPEIL